MSSEIAIHPRWSPYPDTLLYLMSPPYEPETLYLIDSLGNRLSVIPYVFAPDWGPADSNSIVGIADRKIAILHLSTMTIDTLEKEVGFRGIQWSPDGAWFLLRDIEGGIWLIKRDLSEERHYGP